MKDDEEEERYYPYLYPAKKEKELEILAPAEAEDKDIEQIKKDIDVNISYEVRYADEKEVMHEEFEEHYNPENRSTVVINSLVIYLMLMLAWFIVVIVFEGKIMTWLICPLFAIGMVYQRFTPFTIKVTPDKAARKAALISSAAALLTALLYDLIKYLVSLI